jgi:hypothetical protein
MTRFTLLSKITFFASAAFAVFPQSTPSQPLLSGTTKEEIVASAEREALSFPVDPTPPARLKVAFTPGKTAGHVERKCVTGAGLGSIRSGEFVIGGELSGQDPRETRKRVTPKIWWSPLHHSAAMQLLVRGRRVGGGGEYRWLSVTVAHGLPAPGVHVPESEREYFFPSGIEFLHSGTWVLVATQGSDWGCFVLTMPWPVAARE